MKRGTKRNDIKFTAGNGQRTFRPRTLVDWMLKGLSAAEAIERQKREDIRRWFRREYHKNYSGWRNFYFKSNGTAECARRRRQIAKGQLTESNGLQRSIPW